MKQTWQAALEIARNAPRCGAKTRRGNDCQSPAMPNGRCRMHGGKSPGAPCGENHGRYGNGLYTKQAKIDQFTVHALLKQAENLYKQVEEITA